MSRCLRLVNREAFNSSLGINVTGIQENYLRLSIHEGASVSISLVPARQDVQKVDCAGTDNLENCKLYLWKHLMARNTWSASEGWAKSLGHFCMSLAHSIFARKVLSELESMLISHPTWHSRTSSWTLSMKLPESILHAGRRTQTSDPHHVQNVKSHFRTKVMVNDDSINVEGEGAPNGVFFIYIYPNEPSIESLQLMFDPEEKEEIFGKWVFMIR
ncbi:unnamed protein product [Ilex paraguariensis]|uniref:Uncharacterized protein n=1 Tax=Ilex paraguariensis TaxID=185542 RepID=A0ABC8UGM7_9AQUA